LNNKKLNIQIRILGFFNKKENIILMIPILKTTKIIKYETWSFGDKILRLLKGEQDSWWALSYNQHEIMWLTTHFIILVHIPSHRLY